MRGLIPTRLAKVRVSTETTFHVGTAYLITPTLLLTAWHVLHGDDGARLFTRVEVRTLEEGSGWLDVTEYWHSQEWDASLLQLTQPLQPTGTVQWGEYTRAEVVEWNSCGLPDAAVWEREGRAPVNDTAGVRGLIEPHGALERRQLELVVTAGVPSSAEAWEGMSGAPVFSHGYLVGIIPSAPRGFGGSRLYATPVAQLLKDAAFFQAVDRPALVPVPSAGPPLLQTRATPLPQAHSPAALLNARDQVVPFLELWATRQAIRLLNAEDDLQALTVEGVLEPGGSAETWDGVDCALYFGGPGAMTARHVRLERLQYSGDSPGEPWTVARLTSTKMGSGNTRDGSVIARLAKAWKAIRDLRPGAPSPGVALVTNQPVAPELLAAVGRASTVTLTAPKRAPTAMDADEVKLADASGLTPEEFHEFAASLDLDSKVGSRFALEDRVLRAIADWADEDARNLTLTLRQFVRERMLPGHDRVPITREAVLVHVLGLSDAHALFPCPADIARTERLVRRVAVEGATRLLGTRQYLCLHGEGGVGKTTALQQIEGDLPPGSVMVVFDCYGGGRYLDPAALRHRPADAFVQLANEIAAKLRLPLLLSRRGTSDFPRLFMHRLHHAAKVLAAASPEARLVVAIDAADNSVTAARERVPPETSFVHDFVLLQELPPNVRFVVTARTGRLSELRLPTHYERVPLGPFTPEETAENARLRWTAPPGWINEFHRLSNGIPRVQSYAFEGEVAAPEAALERLRPGKLLADVFEERFREALAKNGNPQMVASLCAGLIALARPVPLAALAAVLELPYAQVRDMCSDLAPGIRLEGETAGFADEDFEVFVRKRAEPELTRVRDLAATWLLARARDDSYAAMHVAPALSGAERFADLLSLVEKEPSPVAIRDPIQRREAEVQRLRLALSASRAAGNPSRALRYVLLGAEGIRTEDALRSLLADNPDLAARFATDTIGRLLLSNPDHRPHHGQLLFHQLVVHAERGDAISYREGMRVIAAWMEARKSAPPGPAGFPREAWPLDVAAVAADAEAAFKLEGPMAGVRQLTRWRPRSLQLKVALVLPSRLITEGRAAAVEALLGEDGLGPTTGLFLRIPLALAGRPIDLGLLETGLARLSRRSWVTSFFDGFHDRDSFQSRLIDLLLTGCEVLTARDPSRVGVDTILERFLELGWRRIDRHDTSSPQKLDVVFRAYVLREARAGRVPTASGIFEPRPQEESKGTKRRGADDGYAERHDRELREFTEATFPIYAAVGCALAGLRTGEQAVEELKRAAGSVGSSSWRWRDTIGYDDARKLAARHMLVLFATGYHSSLLMGLALGIDDAWRKGHEAPDEGLVSRLSLRGELHDALVTALTEAAKVASGIRKGARDKSNTLVRHTRLLVPLSPDDAGQVFRLAVDAAGEFDAEGRAQLIMLEKLVQHAGAAVPDRRRTALALGEVVADAAIRLDGDRHFPWQQSMGALARLDTPLALAAVSRWDVLGTANLSETLPPVLCASLDTDALSPAQASALALALEHDDTVLAASLSKARSIGEPNLRVLQEEAARDLLLRPRRAGVPSELVAAVAGAAGPLAKEVLAREQFERTLPHPQPEPTSGRLAESANDVLARYTWAPEALVDATALAAAVQALQVRAREEKSYLSKREILASARGSVPIRDRSRHLDSLLTMGNDDEMGEVAPALASALDAWRNPGVATWCEAHLPGLIRAWLPRLARFLPYDPDELTPFLSRTGLSAQAQRDLLLEAVQRHVDALTSEAIFGLVAYIGRMLLGAEASNVLDWYVARLASRIDEKHLERVGPATQLPTTATDAVARFLVAQLGSPDTRARWRAAHALRRLARTGEQHTLEAFGDQYGREEEPVFSGPTPAFYELAARLWAVIALDRVSGECPNNMGRVASRVLLETALDDAFPHLLLRAFARDACDKLITAGMLEPTSAELERLAKVNQSPLPRVKVKNRYGRVGFRREQKERRFRFDSLDTLPYWYERMLWAFAGLDGDRFLDEAERWIVDAWGWSQSALDGVPRLPRPFLSDRERALTSHRQGSRPTIEPLRTHLEWHAMWCAAGELVKTIPLQEDETDDWNDLGNRILRNQLSEPPVWSADLLVPKPLHPRHWLLAREPLPSWVASVTEADHRLAMLAPERPDYVVVDGHEQTTAGDRSQEFHVSSALVEPATAPALLRALQTMQDSWDYKLPNEGEDEFESDEPPYRLLGWLCSPQRDQGIDEDDPFKGYARYVDTLPGRRVQSVCRLTRDPSGAPRWLQDASRPPMFIHETWGEREEDEDHRNSGTRSVGRRLLAHREQLLEFLHGEKLDLVVSVEVTRRGRETRRYAGAEDAEPPEARFERVYRLDGVGGLHIAEGHLGAWAGVGPQP
ncbi:trypsin-like peptidase domain-containing protein [Myxococcus sp. RHSTA-1-4]|uniref:trypsin-like peptidase domain-containing protein n=1 Tax=Myxococcus sp. RHSTA-1-4 TaxID=2874601 RepID=UPI001CBD4021|nr:trypsin-like peptidase domain-containing protein [Myxococcus sp. RHSTA-1-4]MBZ4421773.1 trypsin-like peptidase domain-containing protein [Myxococcus sp. RHSTA-1-4]